MGRRSYAAVPNRLIEDCSLKHTTKRIAVALLMENRRRSGCIRISLEDLAKRSGCGVSTVQKGLRELTAHGYVTQERNSYYSLTLGRRIYTKNTYRMEHISGGYTLVPRSALRRRGKRGSAHASFSVLIYLYRCAGRSGRAYPSLRHMADKLRGCGASKASVCRALAMLEEELTLIRRECRRMRRDLSCNSYFLTDMVISGKTSAVPAAASDASTAGKEPVFFQLWGGLKLGKLPGINKITGVSILRKREKGVCQFVRSDKLLGRSRICDPPADKPPVSGSRTKRRSKRRIDRQNACHCLQEKDKTKNISSGEQGAAEQFRRY